MAYDAWQRRALRTALKRRAASGAAACGMGEEQLKAETERADRMAAELLAQEHAETVRQHKKVEGLGFRMTEQPRHPHS